MTRIQIDLVRNMLRDPECYVEATGSNLAMLYALAEAGLVRNDVSGHLRLFKLTAEGIDAARTHGGPKTISF